MDLGRTIRTIVHLKPVQIWNRIWRKRLSFTRQPQPPTSTSSLGEFEFLNVKGRPNGWNDPRFEKLWLYNLHYFDYLNNEVELEGRGEQWKLDIVLRWIRENPKGWGNGWEPYPISLRVVNWCKWMAKEGDGNSHKEHREHKEIGERIGEGKRIEESLREQMRWLYPRLEYHLLANHLLANAKALVFAGTWFLTQSRGDAEEEKQGRTWLEKGLEIYRKELPEQTCADGVNFERSPMYHCIVLEDLLDCLELTREPIFREYASKMLGALEFLCGPDGRISKFNDSTEGIAKAPDYLRALAKRLGVEPSRCKLDYPAVDLSGFVRQEAGTWTLLAKCGDIGPSYQPGHAHADTFTFELWKRGRKVIGDTGCSTYVPGPIRSYERSTAAHNTVVIDGKNSSEVWAAHRVGRRFDYGRHRRRFELTAAGLRGVDEVFGSGMHDLEVRFHLPPGVSRDEVRIGCKGELSWEACDFSEGWNLRKPGMCAIFRLRTQLPTTIDWTVS